MRKTERGGKNSFFYWLLRIEVTAKTDRAAEAKTEAEANEAACPLALVSNDDFLILQAN